MLPEPGAAEPPWSVELVPPPSPPHPFGSKYAVTLGARPTSVAVQLIAIDESPDAVVPAPSSGDEQGLVFSVERIGDVASIHFEPSRVAAIANQKQKQMVNMLEVRRMSALAAVMGAIGMGGWLYRSRRQRDEFDVSDGD